MIRAALIGSLVLFVVATVCSAQSSSSSSCSSTSASGASKQQDAAKTQQTSRSPTQPQEASPAEKKRAKKVWTNEELGKAKGGVSVVGGDQSGADRSAQASSSARSSSSSDYTLPTNYEVLVRRYQDKLAPLRSDLADIDRHIQNAKVTMGNAREDTAAYIRVYEDKRRTVLAKIEAIEEEARQQGVLPGDLR